MGEATQFITRNFLIKESFEATNVIFIYIKFEGILLSVKIGINNMRYRGSETFQR